MYREWASRLAGAVGWQNSVPGDGSAIRVLPDGCLDLMWADGELLVAGPDTVAHLISGPSGAAYAGLRFAPGTGPTVLGVPASVLRDQRVPLGELWPAAVVRRLTDQVGSAPDVGAALEEIADDRLRAAGPGDPLPAGIVASLRGGATVAATAEAVGLGERRLHRRCLAAFGYGPKTLARILRLGRALDLTRAGVPFATVAVSAGYADQAHLAREVKALAGVPLGMLTT